MRLHVVSPSLCRMLLSRIQRQQLWVCSCVAVYPTYFGGLGGFTCAQSTAGIPNHPGKVFPKINTPPSHCFLVNSDTWWHERISGTTPGINTTSREETKNLGVDHRHATGLGQLPDTRRLRSNRCLACHCLTRLIA